MVAHYSEFVLPIFTLGNVISFHSIFSEALKRHLTGIVFCSEDIGIFSSRIRMNKETSRISSFLHFLEIEIGT